MEINIPVATTDIFNETFDWKIVSGAPCNDKKLNFIMPQTIKETLEEMFRLDKINCDGEGLCTPLRISKDPNHSPGKLVRVNNTDLQIACCSKSSKNKFCSHPKGPNKYKNTILKKSLFYEVEHAVVYVKTKRPMVSLN